MQKDQYKRSPCKENLVEFIEKGNMPKKVAIALVLIVYRSVQKSVSVSVVDEF